MSGSGFFTVRFVLHFGLEGHGVSVADALFDFDDFVLELRRVVTIRAITVGVTIAPICKAFTVHL